MFAVENESVLFFVLKFALLAIFAENISCTEQHCFMHIIIL
jgi:hypothetical protein